MATFALYNYQFEMNLPDPNLFVDNKAIQEKARENFDRKQEILDEILAGDISGKEKITFTDPKGGNDFKHKYMAKPHHGLYAIQLIKATPLSFHDENLDEKEVADHLVSHVIIDNFKGHQSLAIEDNKKVIGNLKRKERIIEDTFNKLLEPYYLKMTLGHIYDASKFWEIVEDQERYPDGIKKVVFNFPPSNLARLVNEKNKVMSFIDEIRKSYEAKVSTVIAAPSGASVKFNKDDEIQRNYAQAAADFGGDDSAVIYPNKGPKRKVGEGQYRRFSIPSTTLDYIKTNTTASKEDKEKAWDIVETKLKPANLNADGNIERKGRGGKA